MRTGPRVYRSDDRDMEGEDLDLRLFQAMDGNGDWYLSVLPHGDKLGPTVRLTTSGGPRGCEGVPLALELLYRAMGGEPVDPTMHCIACQAPFADRAPVARATPKLAGPRPVVIGFAQVMERKLRANDHKPGWEGDSAASLLARLREETEELAAALESGTAGQIGEEAGDVGNFAMMIADVCAGLMPGARSPTPRDDARREALVQAIRAFTVDKPDGEPNGPAERAFIDLRDALDLCRPDVAKARACEAAERLCTALGDHVRALRLSADAFFGGDFRAPDAAPAPRALSHDELRPDHDERARAGERVLTDITAALGVTTQTPAGLAARLAFGLSADGMIGVADVLRLVAGELAGLAGRRRMAPGAGQ